MCYVHDGCYGNILKCEIVDAIIAVVANYVNSYLTFHLKVTGKKFLLSIF